MSSKDKKKDKSEPEPEMAEEVVIDKEGPLALYSKKWSSHYVMVSGQKLLYKRREKDPEVKGQVELKGATVGAVKDDKKEHAIEIKSGDVSLRLAADSAEAAKEWIEAINVGIAGTADKKGKKKQSLFMAFKKNVAGKAATSSTGKSLIKDQAGPDAVSLIKQLKEVIKLQDGKTKATEIEDNIFKVAVKVILLYRNKDIAVEELLKPKDQIKQLWSDVLDMLEISFCYDAKRLQEQVMKLEEAFEKMLKSYVTDKTITSLRSTMSYLGSEAVLNRLYTANDTEKMRPELEKTLRKLWDQVYSPGPAPADAKKEK